MTKIITPTIGRKVWFWPNGMGSTAAGAIDVFNKNQALDATVVCVYGDRMVNLSVTDHGGRVHSVRSCTLRQDGDEAPGGYYCEWMPYQVSQAKTSEAKLDPAKTGMVIPGTAGLTFGVAIEALKTGLRVARAGWNGKGMWLSLSCGEPREVPAESFWSPHNAEHARSQGGKAKVLPSITMKTATDEILMGWLASQTDMLAEDWCIVE